MFTVRHVMDLPYQLLRRLAQPSHRFDSGRKAAGGGLGQVDWLDLGLDEVERLLGLLLAAARLSLRRPIESLDSERQMRSSHSGRCQLVLVDLTPRRLLR